MRGKLSHIEQIVEVNIVCVVRLDGTFPVEQLRSALARVQRKHPALRALIREEQDGLYYEADSAPGIPLRVASRIAEDDWRRECQTELATPFAYDQPQLRAVCLRSERETDLLLTTTHRMCDGMSVFLIVREVLRSLHDSQELIPYDPVTVRDIIGDYRPAQPWKRELAARVLNGVLRLIPSSRRKPENHEHSLEWIAGRALSDALKQRCKAEGVTLHALLVAALEHALYAVFGKRAPKTIVNPIDLRRGRFAALKSDMVFFGGGNFKVRRIDEEMRAADFWTRVRRINQEMRAAVEEEILDIPGRFDFLERLRPLSSGQIQWMVRLGDALPSSGVWNGFGFSNLGNVAVVDSDSPTRLKDLRLYVHSFGVRLLGLIPYTVNGEMRFYWVIDEKLMSRTHVDRLNHEFTSLLESQALPPDDGIGDASLKSAAVVE